MVCMRPGKRFGLSAIERGEVWNRWKAGQSLHEIGRAFDKPHTSIRHLLLPRGGIPPTARRRSRLSLTLSEREDISRGICSGSPLREIARRMNRAASTVSREVVRHGGRPAYRAHVADDHAWDTRMLGSSGYRFLSHPEICSGDQSRVSLLATISRKL